MKIYSNQKIELYNPDYIKLNIPAYTILSPYAKKEDISALESILNKENNSYDLTDSFFSGKSNILMVQILDLVSQIRERKQLQGLNIRSIKNDILSCDTGLLQLNPFNIYNQDIGRRRNTLELKIKDLEGEKRKEYVECFKDLIPLKKELLESLRAYRIASFRRNLFENES